MKDITSVQTNETVTGESLKQQHPAQQQAGDTVREQIFSGIANRDTFDPPRMTPDTYTLLYGANRLAPLKSLAT